MDEILKVYFDEESATVFLNGKAYPMVSTGRAQARMVAKIGKWLGSYGSDMLKSLTEAQDAENGLEFILGLLGQFDEDALLDLFTAVVGCTPEETDEYFDVDVLISVVVALYNEQPSVKRLLTRFFSGGNTESQDEE